MPKSSFLKAQVIGRGELNQSKKLIELKQKATGIVDIYIDSKHVGIGKLVNQNGHYAVRVLKNLIKHSTV